MSLSPKARRQEFSLAIEVARISDGDVVCDAPSGGGYLGQSLPPELNIQMIEVDPSEVFSRGPARGRAKIHQAPLNDIPLASDSCDAVVSIAGLHHEKDRVEVFRELRRLIRPGGRLCILEVAKDSIVDPFLNQFVHATNSMGHAGEFVDDSFRSELAVAEFLMQRDELFEYTWDFRDEQSMVEFVQLLFGLDKATPDQVLRGISRHLGYRCDEAGECHMNWALQAIVCV
ncbi:MAG: ubiquinone/menaquinone biosynthesis C-methylase UbiE [Glaciecola sp.]|jgi:ubiquinone/menaquinone biosynthesis C-methylase UbiE